MPWAKAVSGGSFTTLGGRCYGSAMFEAIENEPYRRFLKLQRETAGMAGHHFQSVSPTFHLRCHSCFVKGTFGKAVPGHGCRKAGGGTVLQSNGPWPVPCPVLPSFTCGVKFPRVQLSWLPFLRGSRVEVDLWLMVLPPIPWSVLPMAFRLTRNLLFLSPLLLSLSCL